MQRHEAHELLAELDKPNGASQLLVDLTVKMDLGHGVPLVSDRWFLGCWNGINKGLEDFALQKGIDISTPDQRQALVVLCTELYARGRIEAEFGIGADDYKKMRELHPFFDI